MKCWKIKVYFRIPFTAYFIALLKDVKKYVLVTKNWDGEYYWNIIGFEGDRAEE